MFLFHLYVPCILYFERKTLFIISMKSCFLEKNRGEQLNNYLSHLIVLQPENPGNPHIFHSHIAKQGINEESTIWFLVFGVGRFPLILLKLLVNDESNLFLQLVVWFFSNLNHKNTPYNIFTWKTSKCTLVDITSFIQVRAKGVKFC